MMRNVFRKIIIGSFAAFLAAGCTRQSDEKSVVTIQFPESNPVIQQVMNSKTVSTSSAMGIVAGWGYTPATSLTDIKCYGIAISGVDNKNPKKCLAIDQSVAFDTNDLVVAVPAGEEISLEVTSGAKRDIKIFGFSAESAAACRDFSKGNIEFEKLGRPFILSEVTTDLSPGDVVLRMPLSFQASKGFDACDGSFMPPISTSPPGGPNVTLPPSTPAAILQASSSTLDFSSTGPSDPSPSQSVTIENIGNASAVITLPTLAGGSPFHFSGGGEYPGVDGDCGEILAAGDSCTMSLRFQPQSAIFSQITELLSLTYRTESTSDPLFANVSLTGKPIALVNPYGSIPTISAALGNSNMQSFYFKNFGAATANLMLGTVTLSNTEFSVEGNTCSNPIPPGATCTFNIKFTPTPESGSNQFCILSFQYNNGVSVSTSGILPIEGIVESGP